MIGLSSDVLGICSYFKNEALKSRLEVLSAWKGLLTAALNIGDNLWTPSWICSFFLRGCWGPWDKSSSALPRSTPLAASVLGVRLREVPGFSLSNT